MASQPPPGSIIGISSISALVGGGLQTHYTPTKAGILSLMQSCAVALGKHGIRCNALLPGTIQTQLNEEDLKGEEKKRYMEGRIPLGRIRIPEDLVGPAVFLATEMSRYVVCLRILASFGGLLIGGVDRSADSGGWGALCESTIARKSWSRTPLARRTRNSQSIADEAPGCICRLYQGHVYLLRPSVDVKQYRVIVRYQRSAYKLYTPLLIDSIGSRSKKISIGTNLRP